jgi:hypothetical protein
MHARRALLNAIIWFMGRQDQGFQVTDHDWEVSLDNIVGGALLARGMTSVSLKPPRKNSLDEGYRTGRSSTLRHNLGPARRGLARRGF